MIPTRWLVTASAAVVLWLVPLTSAHSAPAHRAAPALRAVCEVQIIEGRKQPGAFPRALRRLRSRLAGQPFKRFRSFRLLKKTTLSLATGRRTRRRLVGPYRFEGQLLARVVTARHRSRLQFRLSLYRQRVSMKPGKRLLRTTLELDRGGTLFLAGPRYRAGRLIFALTCR